MALNELKKDLMEADANIRSYLEHSDEYLKLQVFKVFMRFLTTSLQTILVSVGIIFVLLFISLGASMALCEALDSYYLGFLLVGGFYVLVSILLYVFRKQLNRPLIRKFSTLYFNEL